MQGIEKDYPSEIYAVIGKAVSALLEAGEPLDKKAVLIMLQAHSTETNDKHLLSLYQQAFRYLLQSFH
ncbi:hypothetical protein [Erwinia sp.]|uniref:hypothetical protein n=1 Tax=Erwinia citreus TaxID=558 RepID=UPI003C716AC3